MAVMRTIIGTLVGAAYATAAFSTTLRDHHGMVRSANTTNAFIWPEPAKYSFNADGDPVYMFIDSKIEFSNQTTFTQAAKARYEELTFASHVASPAPANTAHLVITVDDYTDGVPQLDMDESYVLDLQPGSMTLSAKSVWGALRGLETFSQLVTYNFEHEQYVIYDGPWYIEDAPRFPHRGIFIDTARHYQPLSSIRRVLDSMTYAKLNVLHWHMVDSQSFPFQSKLFPKLWEGAFSNQERYTQRDMAAIVEYARLRGIRVMVEFDVPGHAASWCTGYPDICPRELCKEPLDVSHNATFEVITGLLEEVSGGHRSTPGNPSGIFPDDFVHLGGDEVNYKCWRETLHVIEWMRENKKSSEQAYEYFVQRAGQIAISKGRHPVQWSEVYEHFGNALDKDTIVHIWLASTNLTDVVTNGYRVIINPSTVWYLDHKTVSWKTMYDFEPCHGISDDLCPLVIGGHGEMWGETVDGSDIDQTIWPRNAAIAERLWSSRDRTSSDYHVNNRLHNFRCHLLFRGIGAAPLDNLIAREAPSGPGSCYDQ